MNSVQPRTRQVPGPKHGSEYAELLHVVEEAGLMRRRPVHYAVKGSLTLLAFAGAWAVFAVLGDTWWQLFTAVFLAVAYTQIAFLGHDAGHKQIFPRRRVDDAVGIGLAGVHAAAEPGEAGLPAVDGEVPGVPVLPAVAAGGARSALVGHQGRVARRAQGPVGGGDLADDPRRRLPGPFAPNYKGMLTLSKGNRPDFLRKQVLTSHNVTGRPWVDCALGGLNFQIEHHLFPSLPRARRAARLTHLVYGGCTAHEIRRDLVARGRGSLAITWVYPPDTVLLEEDG